LGEAADVPEPSICSFSDENQKEGDDLLVNHTSLLPKYRRKSWRFRGLSIALVVVFAMPAGEFSYAQSVPATEAKLEFDVASVKQNKSDDEPSANFPLGPGDVYGSVGGRFAARLISPWLSIFDSHTRL
jgi:hypothetical protein